MGGTPEYNIYAKAIVKKKCLPAGCVYATADNGCKIKYADEVVRDLGGDGCMAATTLAPDENPFNKNQDYAAVIPVRILTDGTIQTGAYEHTAVPLGKHRRRLKLDNVSDKVIFERE